MIKEILTTALGLAQALLPVKKISKYLHDKPSSELRAETERRRAKIDAEMKERGK